MKLECKKCSVADVDALHKISCETFITAFGHLNTPKDMAVHVRWAFGKKKLLDEISCPGSSFWFFFADGALAGYMKLNESTAQTDIHDPASLEIERIYVFAAFQSRGLGAFQLRKAVSIAQDGGKKYVWLGVWEHNTRAIAFYEKNGFTAFGTHVFYLGDDAQTDVLMRKDLDL